MTILFLALIILAAICLGFVVLIQNPKGGGLSGDISGLSNQFMGVKQTTDTLEKGTWIFAGFLVVACLASSFLLKTGKDGSNPGIPGNNDSKSVGDKVPKNNTEQLPGTVAPNGAATTPTN